MKTKIFILLCFVSYITQGQDIFTLVPNAQGMTPMSEGSIATYDTDGDGVIDILAKTGFTFFSVAGTNTTKTELFSISNGVLTPITHPFGEFTIGAVAIGDLDNQHGVDFVFVGDTSQFLNGSSFNPQGFIYYSDPTEPSGYRIVAIRGLFDANLVLIDSDGDGDLDIKMKGSRFVTLNEFVEYENINGVMNLISVDAESDLSHTQGDLQAADTDNDGDPDLLAQGANSSNFFTNLHINSNGNLIIESNNFTQVLRGSNPMIDINADGFVDIAISGINSTSLISEIYINDGDTNNSGFGNNTFTSIGSLRNAAGNEIGFSSSTMKFGNADGVNGPDLFVFGDYAEYDANGNVLTSAADKRAMLFLNDGNGNFTLKQEFPNGLAQGDALFADLDGDGDDDIYYEGVRGQSGFFVTEGYFYENQTIGAANTIRYYQDLDNDGLGDPNVSLESETQPNGYVLNDDDLCPNIADASNANFDGDAMGDVCDNDDDNDGVNDADDAFPFDASESVDTDNDGTGNNADNDDDNDGFSDNDESQCGSNSLDANSRPDDIDNDGIADCIDTDTSIDSDNDGVNDADDAFPFDASESVDTDNDGTGNNADNDDDNDGFSDNDESQCGSDSLDANSRPDDIDNDGIADCIDTNTSIDSDNDGVSDDNDFCNNTPIGVIVNENGCERVEPGTINLVSRSTTCPGQENASLTITSNRNVSTAYGIDISGPIDESTSITTDQSIIFNRDNLAPGNYQIIVSIPAINFSQEFNIQILDIEDIASSAKADVDASAKTASYSLQANTQYSIELNGRSWVETSDENGLLVVKNLQAVNTITISGEKECQGKLIENISLEANLVVYPSPTTDRVYINGLDSGEVQIIDFSGKQVFSGEYTINGLDMSNYPSGVYMIQVKTADETIKSFKFIKK